MLGSDLVGIWSATIAEMFFRVGIEHPFGKKTREKFRVGDDYYILIS
jgi:hypothetical protein